MDTLTPFDRLTLIRHRDRPTVKDYIPMIFTDVYELHGDRLFSDDKAVFGGIGRLDGIPVTIIAEVKGRDVYENKEVNFAMPHPEGYRKAIGKMRMAAKFGLPVICFIDTPGAFPGVASEERGVAEAIAESMFEMSRLRTPIICVVIGEGGSGGALGIGVGDRVAMLQYSYYSVISPEGCSGILWKNDQNKDKAAEALKFTSTDLLKMKVVDAVIEEPVGGAHRDPNLMASRLKLFLRSQLRQLRRIPIEQLVEQRYQRFRQFGVFFENRQQADAAPDHGALF